MWIKTFQVKILFPFLLEMSFSNNMKLKFKWQGQMFKNHRSEETSKVGG